MRLNLQNSRAGTAGFAAFSLVLICFGMTAARLTLHLVTSRSLFLDNLLGDSYDDFPILVLGLPRSGSLSIHNFFTCSGKRSSHYCCDASNSTSTPHPAFPCPPGQMTCGDCVLQNMKDSLEPFSGCGNYEVWSQFDVETTRPFSWFLPQAFTLPLLHQAYPKSTIILNYRDPSKWTDNVLHWHSVTTRLFHSFKLSLNLWFGEKGKPSEVTYDSLLKEMQVNLDRVRSDEEQKRRKKALTNAYSQHFQKVKDWAKIYGHKVVEVNVDSPDAGNILATAFGGSPDCWNFNAEELDNDWLNFTLPF